MTNKENLKKILYRLYPERLVLKMSDIRWVQDGGPPDHWIKNYGDEARKRGIPVPKYQGD